MKVIGLLGGMSWESSVSYYQAINLRVKQRLGGLHSAKTVLYSVDFHEVERLQHQGDWQQLTTLLGQAARSLEAAGAELLLICTNTMHKVADEVQQLIDIPVVHIADATALQLQQHAMQRVGLLGTRFTMAESFYKDRLRNKFGIEVVTPKTPEQDEIHRVIYEELCLGNLVAESRQYYLQVIEQLHGCGAQAVILGCTEIAMLVQQQHTSVPLFDTTAIHASYAVELALV